jgi:SET domain-containing protein
MEVKTNTLGYGLYATKPYKMGEIVFELNGEKYDKPMRETIYIGNNKHIYDKNGMYMNHSFEPTTYINEYFVVALININEGDELTFNYNENEINMANPFYVDGQLVCGKNT